jgi:two-component system, NarL family, sensor kinase
LVGESLAHLALGEIAMSRKQHEQAVRHYQLTDSIASSINNLNFVHLAHVGLLSNYTALKDYPKAKLVGEKALAELKFVPNTTTEYVIRKNLSDVYAGLSDFKMAYQFRRASDSIYKVTSSIKNKEFINELLIRHQTSRKESQLKIEQKENLVKEAQLTKQTWFLFALGLMLLLALLIFFNYRIRQRNKLNTLRSNQDKELMRALIDGEEKERERIANELHDGLASDLTGIQLILGQSKETIPNGVLDALSRVHEQTRRISHNLSPLHLENLGLVRALRTFTTENTTERTKIHFFSSHESIQLQPIEHGIIVYRMAQELIQNALKHAEASTISVQLMQQENQLTIHVEDDGKGFDASNSAATFGLMNIKKQVGLLQGELSIDSQLGNGTVVFITLDIA